MAFTKSDRADSPMKRRGGRRRKKVCVFCGKENNVIDYLRKNFFFDDRDVTNYIAAYNNIYYNYRHEGLTDVYISINSSKEEILWRTTLLYDQLETKWA